MTEAEVLHLPEDVREKIRLQWANPRNAAKQALCYYLELFGFFKTDHNHVVDVALKSGMLAERLRHGTAKEFIGAFEMAILNNR